MKKHLQCGYEDSCKEKDCMKCGFKNRKYNLKLSLAEQTVIEDFAHVDLKQMIKEKPEELELWQRIMDKIMRKVFREDNPYELSEEKK